MHTLLLSVSVLGQRSLTLKEAEEQLQKNNLQLLAEQFNISVAQAAVVQARIWERPYFSAEVNAINPQDNIFFDAGYNGQKGAAIQQLIYLGGKKKNEIEFAKSNVGIAELQFEQLLRNLKYKLEQTFYTYYFDHLKIATLNIQIGILDTLLNNYNIQAAKGNIPLREVVRLQSLVLNLKNDKNTLINDVIEAQQQLSLLTGLAEPIEALANEDEIITLFKGKSIIKDSLMSLALQNNLDFIIATKTAENQELYLKWQKSLAIPDLTAGISYDQRGGAFQNQVNLTVGIPLMLWNSNKGNIKIAEHQVEQMKRHKEYAKLELQTQVEKCYSLWLQQQNQLSGIDNSTSQNIRMVYEGMIENFQKRNITMLEFTDFMESFNQTSIQINEIKKAWVLASISLNYITNKSIF